MTIIFKKGNSKNSITCKRADGTSTWMEASGFMVVHDLAHVAVEQHFQMNMGFYGLLESGLDITDFERKQKITPQQLPPESIKTELLVNLILTEKHDKKELDNFNDTFNMSAIKSGLRQEEFDDEDLRAVRKRVDELITRWQNLPVNESLIIPW